jgi:mono/diheme cytochrome c family protein
MEREDLLMERVICLVTVLALSVAASHVYAQGTPQQGLAEARQVCSDCHAIQKGQVRSPNSNSPTFVELANTPGMTATALLVAITTPHAGMPMFILTAEQRQDIIAYILSLKGEN